MPGAVQARTVAPELERLIRAHRQSVELEGDLHRVHRGRQFAPLDITSGAEGLRVLALGGYPGAPFRVKPESELSG